MRQILVVDDDEIIRRQLTRALSAEGYEVITAENGQGAIDYLRTHPQPDLVLLDMHMPVLDGWGVLEELQSAMPTLRVVVATAALSIGPEWAAAHGCGFLRKPFHSDEVIAEIKRWAALQS